MMAQGRAETTRNIYNYGQLCRQKMSIMFNEICINEEMRPKYTYIYMCVCVYIYLYILIMCVSVYLFVCVCIYIYIYIYIYNFLL